MVTLREFLMGRQASYPLSYQLWHNTTELLSAVNYLRALCGLEFIVSSGYRPGHYNTRAGGAKNSAHITCEAIDIRDPGGVIGEWCIDNVKELERVGLYLESPNHTPGWVHLQTRSPASGARIFIP